MSPRPHTPVVDVGLASQAWRRALPAAAAICRRAALAAWADAAPRRLKKRPAVEIAVLLTHDRAIRRLNAGYRGKDKPTNVLSFPSGMADAAPSPSVPLMLGDVVVSYGTVAREARNETKPLRAHLSHMVVHGVLHLLGYDHEDATDAVTMERLETKILAALGIADPYKADAPATVRARPAPRTKRRRASKKK